MDSSWLWKEAWSSEDWKQGSPGESLPELQNSWVPRGLSEEWLFPRRVRVDFGLLSTHWRSAEGGLFERQKQSQGNVRDMQVPQNQQLLQDPDETGLGK